MNSQPKLVNLEGYKVSVLNFEEYTEISREIFEEDEYHFSTDIESPTIIDCGSHIGLATLYFKKIFPSAKITCVEPIPDNFALLQMNISQNHLESVKLINAAISDKSGKAEIFAEFDHAQPRYCGSSLQKELSHPEAASLVVDTITLSSLLDDNVDYIKLDIEGMEERVIREIEGKIGRVKEINIEYHGTQVRDDNSLENIKAILERNHFDVEVVFKDIYSIFPKDLLTWVKDTGRNLAVIKASNRDFKN